MRFSSPGGLILIMALILCPPALIRLSAETCTVYHIQVFASGTETEAVARCRGRQLSRRPDPGSEYELRPEYIPQRRLDS